jgi:hypothetical protein
MFSQGVNVAPTAFAPYSDHVYEYSLVLVVNSVHNPISLCGGPYAHESFQRGSQRFPQLSGFFLQSVNALHDGATDTPVGNGFQRLQGCRGNFYLIAHQSLLSLNVHLVVHLVKERWAKVAMRLKIKHFVNGGRYPD